MHVVLTQSRPTNAISALKGREQPLGPPVIRMIISSFSKPCLVVHWLRFAEEIRDTQKVTVPPEKLTAEEMKAAAEIIKALTRPFKPEQFRDEYADRLMKIIEAKSKGKKTPQSLKVVHTNTSTQDLMAKLKESLGTKTKKAS